MIIDLHTHTNPWSDDSYLTADDIIENARKVGIDGICITEHDWFWEDDEIERVCQKHQFLVIPGVEITCEEGHFLVFGIKKYIFGMHRAKFLKEVVDREGAAMVLAHPYRRQFKIDDYPEAPGYFPQVVKACENPIFLMADAVEIQNSRGSEQENRFSKDVCRRLNLKGTGSSDAHKLSNLGTYATYFEGKINRVQDLITELKTGRYWPISLDTVNKE